jgi:hypothetical protein
MSALLLALQAFTVAASRDREHIIVDRNQDSCRRVLAAVYLDDLSKAAMNRFLIAKPARSSRISQF